MSIRIGIGIDAIKLSRIDASAQAFLTATGITDPTITNAINRLVKNYKGIGDLNSSVDLWTATIAIYPLVGGTATTHMYNLKNPVDSNDAFRLSFSGGWTHSSNGALPNGTNAFANTFFTPNLLNQNSARYGYYSRTQFNSSLQVEAGCFNAGNASGVTIGATSGTVQFGRINEPVGSFMSAANTTTLGWFLSNRRASNIENIWKNKTKQAEVSTASVTPNSVSIYIAAQNNNGTTTLYSSKQCSFFVAGAGLSDVNIQLEYDIIQQFQTDLGRAV